MGTRGLSMCRAGDHWMIVLTHYPEQVRGRCGVWRYTKGPGGGGGNNGWCVLRQDREVEEGERREMVHMGRGIEERRECMHYKKAEERGERK